MNGYLTPPPMPFALVDCANFYVSCERVFAPALRGVPVVVLSNNDGCVIARSEEVKAMGVPMGAPYFQHRRAFARAGVRVFSSNYALYADMSHRVMETLRTLTPDVEVYSIDEAFVGLPDLRPDALLDLARELYARVLRWTGIPVRVGVGPTKTLCKVAGRLSKQAGTSVFSVVGRSDLDALLERVPVREVWGVGKRTGPALEAEGIRTARHLRDLSDVRARQMLRVVGLRTVWELRGIPCLPLEDAPPPRQSITRSRSFGRTVTERSELEEAVATHTARAAEKLRAAGLTASALQVFLCAGASASASRRTPEGGRDRAAACAVSLPPSNHTPTLMKAALRCLDRLHEPGRAYFKAGVILAHLTPAHPAQGHLFLPHRPDDEALMAAVDAVNRKHGRGTVTFARCGTTQAWAMRRTLVSPAYTTRWEDLPVAEIG